MKMLFNFDGMLGEFVDALAAVEAIVEVSKIKAYFRLSDPRYEPVAAGAWFTRGLLGPDDDDSVFDCVCDLVADRELTVRAEMEYRQQRKALIDKQIAEIAEKMEVDPESIAKPEDYTILSSPDPLWSRMMGYQLSVRSQSGISGTLVGTFTPFMPRPKGIKDRTNSFLHGIRDQVKPGVPYVVVGSPKLFAEKVGRIVKPAHWEVITVDDSADPDVIVGLISNPRCKAVFSEAGGISHVAWAAGTGLIVELTDHPTQAYWDVTRFKTAVTLDLTNEESTPESICNTIREFYSAAYGVEAN